ncbi:MAG: hypothetical protein KDD22_02775, partial [Bdellovibrionales bacterium]|nr:hypothetical protein [Bdellovibrionales bacterium]
LVGYDKDPQMIRMAKDNAKRAGVQKFVHFEAQPFEKLALEEKPPGIIVANPPYGERLQDLQEAQQLYANFGRMIKNMAPEWDLWILSGHEELTQNLKMKSDQSFSIMNGPIECRWLHYKILPRREVID